jgi:putative transposase
MKGSRFSEEQIIGILREHEAGAKTPDLCRRHGISDATFYIYGRLPVARRFAVANKNARVISFASVPGVRRYRASTSTRFPREAHHGP